MRFLLLLVLMFPFLLWAQVPQALDFQGVARDNNGDPLVSQLIALRIGVIANDPLGPIEYQEVHVLTTSNIGLFSIAIGTGEALIGNFNAIDWTAGARFLKVEMDPLGGTAFEHMGTSQLLSVPYALVAGSVAGDGNGCFTVSFTGDTLHQGNGCYTIIPGLSAANGGCADADGDGFFNQPGCGTLVDCDDLNATIFPGAQEWCGNGIDDNCNGVVDEDGSYCELPNATGVCIEGVCTVQQCMYPYLNCDGLDSNGCETEHEYNSQNCGSCGNVCPSYPNATNYCYQNGCNFQCNFYWMNCDGDITNGCETSRLSPNSCGSCDNVCFFPNGIAACHTIESGGVTFMCVLQECLPNYQNCDGDMYNGCEVNLLTNNSHCGSCYNTCPPGTICNNGVCQ